MRSPAEIISRIETMFDPLGDQTMALVSCLPYGHARPWLARQARRADWQPTDTEDAVRAVMEAHMAYAWRQVAAHRSVPCNRSIERYIGWLFALGDADDVIVLMMSQPYAMFGSPRLAIVCRAYGWPVPADMATRRMIDSLPCREGCDRGCGRLPEFSEVIGKADSD